MHSTSIHRILGHARTAPDRVAIVAARDRITYGELGARVARVASGLAARGVGKGDRVVVLVPMSIELYVVLLAVASIGAVAVFVEPASTLREIARAIRATRPVAFIGVPRAHLLRAVVSAPLSVVVGRLPGTLSLVELESDAPPPMVELGADDPALLTFTSGSTGTPKGAVRSHGFLGAQHDAISRLLLDAGATPDVHLSSFAIVLLSTLVSGGTAVLPGADADGVTVISGSPSFLAPLLSRDLRGVRRIVSGGAPVPVDLCEEVARVAPQARFIVAYGSTEAEPIARIDGAEVCAETAAATRAGAGLCVGRPDEHVTVKLLRPTLAPILIGHGGLGALEVPRGEVGEVVVTGPHVNRRYYRDPAAERATKIVDEAGAVWHRTGDAAYLDGRGRLWLVGRIADIVRRGDAVYHPTAVEAIARTLPWVERAALVAEGERTLLVVEPRARRGRDRDALVRHLATRDVAIDRVVVVDRLPVDSRHRAKLDYPAVRRRWAST